MKYYAYERLILDVIRGDHNLFVRNDELEASWMIYTPILHYLENEHIVPDTYIYGSRGPDRAQSLIERVGVTRVLGYEWHAYDVKSSL